MISVSKDLRFVEMLIYLSDMKYRVNFLQVPMNTKFMDNRMYQMDIFEENDVQYAFDDINNKYRNGEFYEI